VNSKRIGLVGYTHSCFLPFATALEQVGFQVYWIHSLQSFTECLLRNNVAASHIVDISDARQFHLDPDTAANELAQLEYSGGPRINDIILMDRNVRRQPYQFALRYLATAARQIEHLVREQNIRGLASGRDTSLQLIAMLVARKLNVPWAGTTYLRLPNERFMLTRSHHTDEIYPLGTVGDEHYEAARKYLAAFRSRTARPYLRASSSSFGQVIARLPLHVREGLRLIRQARHDRGNNFARYSLLEIAGMYLRKKKNLVTAGLCLRLPHNIEPNRPFALFGLHRQPESSVDVLGAYYSDQPNLIRTIARSLPAGYEFFVKIHASDADGWPLSFYRGLQSIPAVRLIPPGVDSRALIEQASIVITNSGTMALEAALLGRPAITFGRVHFNPLPSVRCCTTPTLLPQLIDELLQRKPAPEDEERVVEFMAQMHAWSFAGLPNRSVFNQSLTQNDIRILQQAYTALFEFTAAERGAAQVEKAP
jgi:hypothetical protein